MTRRGWSAAIARGRWTAPNAHDREPQAPAPRSPASPSRSGEPIQPRREPPPADPPWPFENPGCPLAATTNRRSRTPHSNPPPPPRLPRGPNRHRRGGAQSGRRSSPHIQRRTTLPGEPRPRGATHQPPAPRTRRPADNIAGRLETATPLPTSPPAPPVVAASFVPPASAAPAASSASTVPSHRAHPALHAPDLLASVYWRRSTGFGLRASVYGLRLRPSLASLPLAA